MARRWQSMGTNCMFPSKFLIVFFGRSSFELVSFLFFLLLQTMGDQYYYGTDVVQSYVQAYSLYKLSAAQGHLPGIINMGTMHQLGLGTDQSNAIARKFWSKAAKAGFERAQKYLAALDQFENGSGGGGGGGGGGGDGDGDGEGQEVNCIVDGGQFTKTSQYGWNVKGGNGDAAVESFNANTHNRNGSIYAVSSV